MRLSISKNTLLICLTGGLVLTVLGAVLALKVFPSLVENKLWENVILRKDSEAMGYFMKVPFPFAVKIYFFNVENPNEIMRGEKPKVEEVGPYVYKMWRWRDELTWEDDEITYYEYLKFEFDDAASGRLSDTDKITIFNSAYYAFLLKVEETAPDSLALVADALDNVFHENANLFMTVRVKDILFDGLPLCKNWGENGDFVSKTICKQVKEKVPESKTMRIANDSILYSTLYFKNNTHQGRFTINSGVRDRNKLGKLTKYENEPYLPVWDGKASLCNKIRGVVLFQPFVNQNQTFDLFGEDICRIVTVAYDETVTWRDIEGYKFTAAIDTFHSPEHNPDNACFCSTTTRVMDGKFGCPEDGMIDLTKCAGAPILMSFPHLLYGDRDYIKSVDGLNPNESLHVNYFVLEPTTGVPLMGFKRIQFNMFLRKIDDVPSLENVTQSVMPMFWLEESIALPDDWIDLLKSGLFKIKLLDYFKWGIIGIGMSIFAVTFLLIIKQTHD